MSQPDVDVLIIGGGPAGLTAGIYTARANLSTRIIEKMTPGGQIFGTDRVDNYPGFPEGVGGVELADNMKNQAERFGSQIDFGEVTGIESDGKLAQVALADGGKIVARAVLIATGSDPRKLGVPGEKELAGRGVSYCATCDGAFFKDMPMTIVGGGNSAVEEGLFLTRFGSEVALVHRRDELRAEPILRDKVMADPKMKFEWNSVVESIHGNDKGDVEHVILKDVNSGETRKHETAAVFIFIGHNPNTGFLKGVVDLDDTGYVITNKQRETSMPLVWAAGDVQDSVYRQLATSIGDGCRAAMNIAKHLSE